MATSKVTYLGKLRTEAEHLESGTRIFTDAPKDNQGEGAAFSPTDLLATSLAACMISIMGIVARRDNIQVEGITAEVVKVMFSEPRRVGEIHVKISFPVQYSERDRKLLEHAALTCPVAKSIHPDIQQKVEFVYP